MRWLHFTRILVVLSVFTVEIQIKAHGTTHENSKPIEHKLPKINPAVEWPSQCLKSEQVCSLIVKKDNKFSFKGESLHVAAKENSVIVRESDKVWRFVEGTVWFKSQKSLVIETAFGRISSDGGDIWLKTRGSEIEVAVVAGEAKLEMLGFKQAMQLPMGYRTWVSTVGERRRVQVELPQMISIPAHLHQWAELYIGTKASFKNEARAWVEDMRQITEEASRGQEKLANRWIASQEAQLKAAEESARQTREEEARMRQLFRERNFVE